MNIKRNIKGVTVPRTLLPALGVLSALIAFGGSAMAASTVIGNDDPINTQVGDDDGPVTPRVVVASGTSEHFGDWELVASQDKSEQPCVGLRFTSLPFDSASLSEDERLSKYGPPRVAEACGASVENQVGNFTARPEQSGGTLFFGRVADDASDVSFVEDGETIKTAEAISGTDGRKYVVVETVQRHPEADVVVTSSSGESLGRVDPKAMPATE